MGTSTTVRRLLQETRELSGGSSKPNPSFHAQPVSDTDLFQWHFTLLGPPSPSPYAGGLYHGRISLPLSYPLKPPNFRFLTPSGRFEVNREICLSISGFHEESWMPAWGIRTALVALRTFMGEDGTAGQVGGMEASREVRQSMAESSRRWRCEACGGSTNEEIMKDWWRVCSERGSKVEEEAGLEELPAGLKLGFQDQLAKTEATTAARTRDQDLAATGALAGHAESVSGIPSIHDPVLGPGPSQPDQVSLQLPHGMPNESSTDTANSSPPSNHPPNGGNPSNATKTTPPPSTGTRTRTSPPITAPATAPGLTSAATATATATTTTTTPPPTPPMPPTHSTPILDKAISGLVLALLVMVLKKVLYDPNVMEHDEY